MTYTVRMWKAALVNYSAKSGVHVLINNYQKGQEKQRCCKISQSLSSNTRAYKMQYIYLSISLSISQSIYIYLSLSNMTSKRLWKKSQKYLQQCCHKMRILTHIKMRYITRIHSYFPLLWNIKSIISRIVFLKNMWWPVKINIASEFDHGKQNPKRLLQLSTERTLPRGDALKEMFGRVQVWKEHVYSKNWSCGKES